MAQRGGKREGAGRKRREVLPTLQSRTHAEQLLAALNRPAREDDSHEVKRWRKFTEAEELRISLDASKFLDDKAHHKAIQPVTHGTDKPLEINVHIRRIGS